MKSELNRFSRFQITPSCKLSTFRYLNYCISYFNVLLLHYLHIENASTFDLVKYAVHTCSILQFISICTSLVINKQANKSGFVTAMHLQMCKSVEKLVFTFIWVHHNYRSDVVGCLGGLNSMNCRTKQWFTDWHCDLILKLSVHNRKQHALNTNLWE